MLITLEDTQRIGDEETLMHFLKEKLNLPIPEKAILAQIALPLPLLFLGLDNAVTEQIVDCQDFSGLPQDALGERRPFLIRFRYESNYLKIIREVAESLHQKITNPAALFFICAAENFQPFAFAYFNDSAPGDWHTAVLTVLAWTQSNTHIHTSSEHELSADFFVHESPTKPDNTSKDDIEFEREEGSSENNVVPIKPEDDSEDELPGKRDDMSPNYRVKRTSSEDLLVKLEDTGTRLGKHWNIHEGISTGCDTAFLIDELKRQQLIDENVQSDMLIKSQLRPSQKWEGTSTPLIYIPSSEDIPWNWSACKSGAEAEGVFADNYPAIRKHLKGYAKLLVKPKFKGKFYWEWPPSKLYAYLERPKIVYPYTGSSMKACYNRSGFLVLGPAFFIPTEDFFLLGILNSKLFDWYAKARYQEKLKGPIEFKQSNMASFPVAAETIEHKANLSDLVQQILDDPDNLEIFDIEWEIDQLVYELYELTTAEIDLIEKGNNQ